VCARGDALLWCDRAFANRGRLLIGEADHDQDQRFALVRGSLRAALNSLTQGAALLGSTSNFRLRNVRSSTRAGACVFRSEQLRRM